MDTRTHVAALAMAGINAGLWANNELDLPPVERADDAVRCADALLARLAETAPEATGDAFASAAQDAGRHGMGAIRLGADGPKHVTAEAVWRCRGP